MRSPHRRSNGYRTARLESFEPRLVFSAAAVSQLAAEQLLPASLSGVWAAGNTKAFDVVGLTEALRNYDFTGEGQTVVIIDSGVAYDHAALGGGLGSGQTVVGGWDFAENDADPYDDGPYGSHGTHVAGILASSDANNPGIAPGADIVALRVFNDAGQTQIGWVEKALAWVHDHLNSFASPITTVNLSMGVFTNSASPATAAVLEDELAQLAADGVFITAAAGNGFTTFGQPGLSYPASSPYVTAVGSVDASGSLSYFTQRAASMIAAPGRSVSSTVPDYVGNRNGVADDFAQYSGTSMASPFVAGAAMLVREAYASAGSAGVSAATIYQTLYHSADQVYDSSTGASYRRLNVGAAIASALSAGVPADDYGSSAATAWPMGQISGDVTLEGQIGTQADRDYFTFIAAKTGRVEVAVTPAGPMDVEVQRIGASASQPSGDTLAFDVVAGQQYTVAVETAGGLGRYTLNLRLDTSSSAVAETIVDQWEAASESISSSGKTYGFTAAYSGIFTVVASFQHGRGDVDLELVDRSGRRLAWSTSSSGSERIDVTLSAGETVYLRASTSDGLTNPDVDLRVTNLVSRQGGTLVVRGTSRADQFQFVAGSAWRVTINGATYELSADSVSSIRFDGMAGSDRATLYGTDQSDSAVLEVGSAEVSGAGYRAVVANTESIEIVGRGGSDSVSISDSTGNDTFTALPGYAAMTGSGFSLVARQFEAVHAYARYGGQDEASVNDSAGDDMFTATTDGARMAGDDYLVRVRQFDTVHAYARAGGTDRARMTGSSSGDTLVATPQYARLVSRQAVVRAKLFEEVEVLGGGGSDWAYLNDSAGNDWLVASADAVTMSGTGYANTVRGFTQTVSTASAGGADSAVFTGSAGADAFFADSAEARMSGSGYDNLARGFRNVTARSGGGEDQATLVDSALDDHLAAWGNVAQMQSSALVAWLYDFDQVRAVSRSGGNDSAEISAVDYVLQVSGGWDRD